MILENAVIIAGGKGARLEEKTESLPKPMVPVGGIPLIERVIRWLGKNGVKRVYISVAYKKEKITDYLKDGKEFGIDVRYTYHDAEGGTEDAFRAALEQANIPSDNFYAMNSDQITDLQLDGLTNSHLMSGTIATIVTVKLRTNFGIIEIDNENRITRFQEKDTIPDVLINSGIYVFNQGIRGYLNEGNIEENAFRRLVKDGKIRSFYYDGVWLTINDKKELRKAEDYLSRYNSVMANRSSVKL